MLYHIVTISDKMSRLVKVSLRNRHNSFQTTENQEPVYQYTQYSMGYEKKRKNKGKRVEWSGKEERRGRKREEGKKEGEGRGERTREREGE